MFGGVMPKYFRDLKKNVGGGGWLCPNILDFKNVSGGGGYANKFYGLKKIVDRAVECVAIAIRELCDMRDSDDTQVFSDSELKFKIDMLCTK